MSKPLPVQQQKKMISFPISQKKTGLSHDYKSFSFLKRSYNQRCVIVEICKEIEKSVDTPVISTTLPV